MLVPRRQFFGNPNRARTRISPDGSVLAFLAPLEDVLNIWVAPGGHPDRPRPLTRDTGRGIRDYFWSYTSRHILYTQDTDGDENFRLYSIDIDQRKEIDLTPFENVVARLIARSEKFPDELMVGINSRPPHQLHDIWRINLVTGDRELILENPGLASFVCDDNYNVRFATSYTDDGGRVYLKPGNNAEWQPYLEIPPEDVMTSGFVGFDKTARSIYMFDSRGRNRNALMQLDLATGDTSLLVEHGRADISDLLVHPREKHVQAVACTFARREWLVLDESIQADLDYLSNLADGELQITSRTMDDSVWTVAFTMDDGPTRFYMYRREPTREAEFLFTSDSALEELPLVKMHDRVIRSRDDLELVSYLSLPDGVDLDGDGRPSEPLPLVLLVHGGPWSRNSWGYDARHQLWANRGYAVLSVNYRGSTGFGKEFINAANRQWAGKMHDDLLDAVQWAVEQGIANPEKIAIMGGSYGGYATLVGLTFTPEVFTCGVDLVGPSSLVTLLENPPPYWMPLMPIMKDRVGDFESDEGRAFLQARSPLHHADKIKRPLLIAQGAQDPRVKQAESDQIVEAMKQQGIPVTYLLFPSEGHGFARPENRFAFYAVAEAFLGQHLGGSVEPWGDAFSGAEVEIPAGVNQVSGLEAALGGASAWTAKEAPE